jgi:hypothetical protein
VIPRRLLIINVLLLMIAGGSAAFIAQKLMAPVPRPLATRSRTAPAPSGPAGEAPRPQAGAYASVAARNLFSPTRTESPPTPTLAASPAVKPNLFGVVLRDGAPIAYLEDPTTKRVAGYRVGDAVAGGTVQTISADSVVINRVDGSMDVRLRDPGKPRQAPATAGVPGAQPVVSGPSFLPGVIPPAAGVPAAPAAQPPAVAPAPGQVQPSAPPLIIPPRRPLPPNLLRRLPQGSPTDAPQQ